MNESPVVLFQHLCAEVGCPSCGEKCTIELIAGPAIKGSRPFQKWLADNFPQGPYHYHPTEFEGHHW